MGLNELRQAVERLHSCAALHAGSAPVHEEFQGQIVWSGQVEIFDVIGHSKAERCYAWEHETDCGGTKYQAILALPPVDSPEAAVRVAIVAEHRRGN